MSHDYERDTPRASTIHLVGCAVFVVLVGMAEWDEIRTTHEKVLFLSLVAALTLGYWFAVWLHRRSP